MASKKVFEQLEREAARIQTFMTRAPKTVGQLAVREFVGNFKRQSFQNEAGVEQAWPNRKVRRYKRKSGKKATRLVMSKAGKADRGRALLVQSGTLRRSIRVDSLDSDSVTISTDSEYAQAHNEGHKYDNRTLPQRQFMGASRRLNEEVITYLKSGVDAILTKK
ncbi:phage virion morphogenesis protein [Hymenobacter sp. YC55]|uniref:phage virion morphogenesis protein n=1 Tax=Hymenobacter sp. YC55 TaxID=3034019 RepID=UPI0023F6A38A|nr:phage virion morphogenesis protein [Hymenobacter sp. YC55]MDF7813623.1 phage virion morphogenesis protein [Hymenobacter sp. YC55]